MNKRGFLLALFVLVLLLCVEVCYLSLRPEKSRVLKEFVQITSVFAPALYSNSFSLRHRDMQNSSILTPFHPSLREFEVGTFVQNYTKSAQ